MGHFFSNSLLPDSTDNSLSDILAVSHREDQVLEILRDGEGRVDDIKVFGPNLRKVQIVEIGEQGNVFQRSTFSLNEQECVLQCYLMHS